MSDTLSLLDKHPRVLQAPLLLYTIFTVKILCGFHLFVDAVACCKSREFDSYYSMFKAGKLEQVTYLRCAQPKTRMKDYEQSLDFGAVITSTL